MSEKEKMSQNGTEETGKETKPAKAEKTKADKPKAKSDKEKKPGFFKRLGRFFREDRRGHPLRHRRGRYRLDLRWHCQRRGQRAPRPLRRLTAKGE